MGENPDAAGWVNPRLPLTSSTASKLRRLPSNFAMNPDAAGWVNPRRPLTAMKLPSGGVAGDVCSTLSPCNRVPCRRFTLCRPPVATTTRYLPLPADSPSDDDGLAGDVGVEGASPILPLTPTHRPPVTETTEESAPANSPSDDDGLAGRLEAHRSAAGDAEANGAASLESSCNFSLASLPPHIIALNPELWAKCCAEAEVWMDEEMNKGALEIDDDCPKSEIKPPIQ